MESLTVDQLYLGWTFFFTIAFGTIAFFKAPNDLFSIARYLIAAGGLAMVAAVFFTVPMWIVILVAR